APPRLDRGAPASRKTRPAVYYSTESTSMWRPAFAIAAVGWASALPLAAWMASRPHHGSLPYAFAFGVYGIGAWICHQRPERSFYLWAMQLPVCARCTRIYVGAAF